MRLAHKAALVTGAGGGIGRATVAALVREGCAVAATDLAAPRGTDAPLELALDVTDDEAWARAVEHVLRTFGSLDVLVQCAGVLDSAPVPHAQVSQWQHVLDVDATGAFLGVQAVLPTMIAAGAGSIVTIASIWGTGGARLAPAYHAAKSAVVGLTKHVAVTYARAGVRANSVHPGTIDTALSAGDDPALPLTPMGRRGTPDEVANAVVFLASDEASYITGAELAVDGGYRAQ